MSPANIAPISTDRLTLRVLTGSDVAALHRFRGNREATRFLSHGALTVEENRQRLEDRLAQAEASTEEWFNYGWAIILQESGEIIGDGRTWNSSASPISGVMPPGDLPVRHASLGYILHPDHHGRGYGREAAGALVDWLFRERGISTVLAAVYEPNLASMKLLHSLGFTQDCYVPSELDKFGRGLPSLRFRLDKPASSR